MVYTGLECFMEKLKKMIYNNDDKNPLSNHPSILFERPQLQRLYELVDSMIQALYIFDDQHNELQQVRDLRKRFIEAAEEAHDIIDLFVYNINLGTEISLNKISLNQPTVSHPGGQVDGYIEDVMRSIKSIKEELSMICNDVKMSSSSKSYCKKAPSADVAGTTGSTDMVGTKKVSEGIVVGFDRHAELIRDKLVEDQKQLDVVSIVGMGGLGKTTLATKVFTDPFIIYHFHIRGWVTVSQAYEKGDLLVQILDSIGIKLDSVGESYCRLREKLHKTLMGQRYLIVIDDIWTTKAWDDMKLFFPNHHTASRIMLTSRHKEVASHARSHGFIHHLECLTEDESWELLHKKVFQGDTYCPKSLIWPGMQIAKNCHGLPLSLVAIAGVLGKEGINKNSWETISRRVSSYIVSDQTGYKETLALSLDHLPRHLRHCFLYLGGFPEDHKFGVQRLIWLWMAEGFIQEEDGIRSLEEIAEDHVMELVDRNLIVVSARTSNGGIKSIYVHDLLRELCAEIAKKERFFLKTQHPLQSHRFMVVPYKQRRIFIEQNISIRIAPWIRSFLCFNSHRVTRKLISNWSHFWILSMVLDLGNWELDYFPKEISLLVHLRYLALRYDGHFPSSICKLWNLQSLIFDGRRDGIVILPDTISNLVNLRHLYCGKLILFPSTPKPMNLQTISMVVLADGVESWAKCFPGIKKLKSMMDPCMDYDFESLNFLEKLKLRSMSFVKRMSFKGKLKFQQNHIGFPASLKELTLEDCYLTWNEMSMIQSLPNLEVLKLLCNSFVGNQWDAGDDEQFQKLKFLKFSDLDIQQWEASDVNFPCLEQLVLINCIYLKEIPLGIGYIPTLERINIHQCDETVVESLHEIQKEQHALGNFELKINRW